MGEQGGSSILINYDLSENEHEDSLFCETCGTYFWDTAELNTEAKTVQVNLPHCFGDNNHIYTLQEFLDEYEEYNFWPAEPFNTLVSDVKELLND